MTEEIFGYLAYSTMLLAAVALLWSQRNLIKKLLSKKVASSSTNEYGAIMKNKAVQFALNWKDDNHGEKQNESVFRKNGKIISKSEAYKITHKQAFDSTNCA
jgi:hypothetical protein